MFYDPRQPDFLTAVENMETGLVDHDPPTPDGKPRRGRPRGSTTRLQREAIELAKREGRLPHEILLSIARGEPVRLRRYDHETGELTSYHVCPTLTDVMDAAKSAAPYYAPRISTVAIIKGVDDDELDRLIALAAAEAGLGLVAGGEGEEDEGSETDGSSTRRRRAVLGDPATE